MSESTQRSLPTLPLRVFGRTARHVSPIIWRAGPRGLSTPNAPSLASMLADAGLNTFFIDSAISTESMASIFAKPWFPGSAGALWVGVDLETILGQGDVSIDDRMNELPGKRCAAVVLQEVTANDLKTGRPYQRFSRLLDEGRADLLILEAGDTAQAEWMIENTAAHGILLRYDPFDQSARYRALTAANELGMGIIAAASDTPAGFTPDTPIDASMRRRFALADAEVASALAILPADEESLLRQVGDYASPLGTSERDALWQAYQRQVPEPKKPHGGHPPEFG